MTTERTIQVGNLFKTQRYNGVGWVTVAIGTTAISSKLNALNAEAKKKYTNAKATEAMA